MFLEHGRHGRLLLRRPKALGAQVQRMMGMCQAGDIGYQGIQFVTCCRLSKLLGDVPGQLEALLGRDGKRQWTTARTFCTCLGVVSYGMRLCQARHALDRRASMPHRSSARRSSPTASLCMGGAG